jgi:hypothetical protein
MSAVTIKEAIKANLDALVEDEVLGGATITDIKKDPLAADIPTWPHAFLMPPAVESETIDNRSIMRTYSYDIMVLFKAENISGTAEIEEAIEAILDQFDNDPTLGGEALGGVLPVSSAPQPMQHQTLQLIMVAIQIQAKQHVDLTFA